MGIVSHQIILKKLLIREQRASWYAKRNNHDYFEIYNVVIIYWNDWKFEQYLTDLLRFVDDTLVDIDCPFCPDQIGDEICYIVPVLLKKGKAGIHWTYYCLSKLPKYFFY